MPAGETLAGILRGDVIHLPAYESDRPQTFVVKPDNCIQEGTHWVASHFPISGPPNLILITRTGTGDIPSTF